MYPSAFASQWGRRCEPKSKVFSSLPAEAFHVLTARSRLSTICTTIYSGNLQDSSRKPIELLQDFSIPLRHIKRCEETKIIRIKIHINIPHSTLTKNKMTRHVVWWKVNMNWMDRVWIQNLRCVRPYSSSCSRCNRADYLDVWSHLSELLRQALGPPAGGAAGRSLPQEGGVLLLCACSVPTSC